MRSMPVTEDGLEGTAVIVLLILDHAGQCDQCLKGWNGRKLHWLWWLTSDLLDNVTHVLRDGLVTTVTPVLEDGLGENCTEICPVGWAGTNCDVCEFGFNTTSNCTECIQNGQWTGKMLLVISLTATLTFDGPACSNLSGMYWITVK